MNIKLIKYIFILLLVILSFNACSGEDYTPVYFPPQQDLPEQDQVINEGVGVDCSISFTSQLCIKIAGAVEAGLDPEDPLCAEIDPFPIHISGTEVSMIGSEFPDTTVNIEGLPEITLNGKGNTTGDSNIGQGEIDSSGNITIEGFKFYIEALGFVGEVPDITLTTASSPELPDLPAEQGSPPDVSGAMTLVGGTIVGHLFDGAEALEGASLQVRFHGAISPTLDECSQDSGPASIEIKKIFVDQEGKRSEIPLPEGKRLEISSGTFIAQDKYDIGPHFETTAKFSIQNISSKSIAIQVPSKVGPFIITSYDNLATNLSPQQIINITITFRPNYSEQDDLEPGEVIYPLIIGTESFKLIGVALDKDGLATISRITEDGELSAPDIDELELGNLELPANSEKAYFKCETIECGEASSWANCTPCAEDNYSGCELLPITTTGKPYGEVNESCELIEKDATPQMAIDLRTSSEVRANKEIIVIQNHGALDLTVQQVTLSEAPNSQSINQFSIQQNAFYLAENFADVVDTDPVSFPITLPPYQPGFQELSLFIVVTYSPTDLIGYDGVRAGIGSAALDKAFLKVTTSSQDLKIEVKGKTAIKEIPALELYFKTSTGPKQIANGETFSFKDVTAETIDNAVPLFLKLSDTESRGMRVVSIRIEGEDAQFFEWLDTAEKINAISPPTGQGKRCSIPIIDPTTGNMTREIFDLNPVSLGSRGFDLQPGVHTLETMPLFGCVNYHANPIDKTFFEADLVVTAQKLDVTGNPERNPDGTYLESELKVKLAAAVNPITGQVVLRITQTSATILNPQMPGISAIAAQEENLARGFENEDVVFFASLILDPFDEETIYDSTGQKIISTPNDNVTAVLKAIHGHPVNQTYNDPLLFDYVTLIHDNTLEEGMRGIFDGYPEDSLPENLRIGGWRIFTSTFSYPGPVPPEGVPVPQKVSDCEVINPCSEEGFRKFTDDGVGPDHKGACAFFYASGGRYDSPAFHPQGTPLLNDAEGEYKHPCDAVGVKQNLIDLNTGHYSLDGALTLEEIGFRFFGPTIYHQPYNIIRRGTRPLDAIFHVGFTTETLKPLSPEDEATGAYNVLPDERIDFANQGYMINLTDPRPMPPALCPGSTQNREIAGKTYSTWKYLAPFLSQDPEGKIPAGCPEPDNDFEEKNTMAYLHGRRVNHETGNASFVAAANFGPDEELTFAFKDHMIFIVLNGWLCDPKAVDDPLQGQNCFNAQFNERDARSQVSIMDEEIE
ncbi:MAG: hypothetical protein ABH859_02325 [Pseudomonadota bacterium]